jgi:hypothetical protein
MAAPARQRLVAAKDGVVTLQTDFYRNSIAEDGRGLCWFCLALQMLTSLGSPFSAHPHPLSLIATDLVRPLGTSSDLVDQFVCLESNGFSADRAAVVISEVLRQSTSLTSTPPLRPRTSWNINRSPSLWYLVTS